MNEHPTPPNSLRQSLMWDTAIGFVGFFAFLALIQAVLNMFRDSPALWPGILAAILVAATFALIKAKRARFNP